ncbi:hypothetical protein [Streptomyces sp900116325]|uniref:hypothetical protein n=1 Tax=Streptomyces sp. 900116325 TaxID=3154295 RepID=UPI003331136B
MVTVGDGTGFPTAAHLASYAGLPPPPGSPGPPSTTNTRPEAETDSQTRHVPPRLRLHERRPSLPRPLRQAASPRQNPRPGPPLPRPPTHQRPVRPCSETARCTNPAHPRTSNSPRDPSQPEPPQTQPGRLDERHRGTRPRP